MVDGGGTLVVCRGTAGGCCGMLVGVCLLLVGSITSGGWSRKAFVWVVRSGVSRSVLGVEAKAGICRRNTSECVKVQVGIRCGSGGMRHIYRTSPATSSESRIMIHLLTAMPHTLMHPTTEYIWYSIPTTRLQISCAIYTSPHPSSYTASSPASSSGTPPPPPQSPPPSSPPRCPHPKYT